MGAIGASAFIFRDFLKYILPAIIAACLFVPFLAPIGSNISVDLLVFVSALSGYIIYSPVAILASKVQSILPFGLNLSAERSQARWWMENWDYNALWSRLDKDEREYIYLTQSYFEFYQTIGFYLLLYALANLGSIGINVTNGLIVVNNISDILEIKTQMIGNWHVWTPLITLIALIFSWYMFKDAIIEHNALFLENGSYIRFAEKYHTDKGNVARSIWGKVYRTDNNNMKPLPNVTIRLIDDNNSSIDETKTDVNGQYQLIDKYTQCINKDCKLVLMSAEWSGEMPLKITEKSIPHFDIGAIPKTA